MLGARECECSDMDERLLTKGRISCSLVGPVDLMKSAKSRVDSVSTCGSRAMRPLFRCTLVLRAAGRESDRRFSLLEDVPSLSLTAEVACFGA